MSNFTQYVEQNITELLQEDRGGEDRGGRS